MKCWLVACAIFVTSGCGSAADESVEVNEPVELAPSASSATVAPPPSVPLEQPPTRSGSAMVRTPDGAALLVADEDHAVLRRVALPLDPKAAIESVALPGPPAAVLSLGKRVLVTVRDPGLLLFMRDEGGRLVEEARLPVGADAWGLAVTVDLKTALVTSAWTHALTAIDIESASLRWKANLAREPRGITITSAGVAYVTHLVGSRLTRIDGLNDSVPKVSRVELPAAPMRAAYGTLLDASLGYASVLNADESRLFAGRHALGGQSARWWFGAATVDGLLTATDAPVSPPHQPNSQGYTTDMTTLVDIEGAVPIAQTTFVQPRALAFRKRTNTILVASEGKNDLVELDARAIDPTLARTALYQLGSYEKVEHPFPAMVISGGAPTAIALSADDKTAYVFCRSTYDVQEVALAEPDQKTPADAKEPRRTFVTIASDTLDAEAAKGRKLFYDATDPVMSGGLGCAGCHPDGRDDGHVWHEISDEDLANGYRGATVLSSLRGAFANDGKGGGAVPSAGHARQTPMLAGRVAAAAPYGWLGESPNLESRLRVGFALHRWQGDKNAQYLAGLDRPKQLARFIREGLSKPAVDAHQPTAEELRGKALFEDAKTQCATCHAPATEFTDRSVVLLARPPHRGFDEEKVPFKTPSLLFVGGTPPYFHDGAADSLEALIDKNGTQMGSTVGLDAADKRALAAYLRTIGGYVAPFPEEAPITKPKVDPGNVSGLGRRPDHGFWRGIKDPPFPKGYGCSVRREGAWFHVTCPKTFAGIQLLAGTVAGVETWFGQREDFVGATGHLVFPMREGERKVFQFTQDVMVGRWGTTNETAFFVQADWGPGQAEPTILFTVP